MVVTKKAGALPTPGPRAGSLAYIIRAPYYWVVLTSTRPCVNAQDFAACEHFQFRGEAEAMDLITGHSLVMAN